MLTLCHSYLSWQQHAVNSAASVFQYNCELFVYLRMAFTLCLFYQAPNDTTNYMRDMLFDQRKAISFERCFVLNFEMNGWP
jgi:hypothetical protein